MHALMLSELVELTHVVHVVRVLVHHVGELGVHEGVRVGAVGLTLVRHRRALKRAHLES